MVRPRARVWPASSCAKLVVVAAMGWPGTATAQAVAPDAGDVTFAVRDDAVAGLAECGGAQAVRDAVEDRLHRRVFATGDADIVFDVRLDEVQGVPGFLSVIVERGADGSELGRREVAIEGAECGKRIETLAVVLAIMIGPPRRRAEAAPPKPPPVPPRAPAVRPEPERPPPRRWAVEPVGEVVAGTGILPGVAGGVQLGAVIVPPVPRVHGIARANYWPPRSTGTIAAADVDRLGGSLLLCLELLGDRRARPNPEQFRGQSGTPAQIFLSGCGGVDGGRLHATTEAFTRASETGLLMIGVVEGRAGWRAASRGGLTLEPVLGVQIGAPFRRDRFTYRDGTGVERTLLQPAPVAFQASLGLAVHFL